MSLYQIEVTDIDNQDVLLETYQGKVLLIVNTATACYFTPQYKDLQDLYSQYKGAGFEVLDFPCNQFGEEASGSIEEINQFCTVKYETTFPRFQKVDVNGASESPLFTYLKSQEKGLLNSNIKWNFTKFLVDQQGNVIKRYAPTIKPAKIAKDIDKLLKKSWTV